MDIIRYGIIFVSAISLTLAAINLGFWIKDRRRWEVLVIVSSCVSTAVYSWFEIALMGTRTVETYGEIMRWAHVPLFGIFVGLAVFIRLQLKAGRLSLMWLIIGMRVLTLAVNFLMPVNINFLEITAVKQITIFGQDLYYATGVTNPWILLTQSGFPLLLIYSIDAWISVRRRRDSDHAWIFAGGVVLMALTAMTMSVSIFWHFVEGPMFASLSMMFVLLAMTFQLNRDLNRSQQLAYDLERTELELQLRSNDLSLSVSALQDIQTALDSSSKVVITDEDGNIKYVNKKFCELSGYDEGELLGKRYHLTDYEYHSREFVDEIRDTVASGVIWKGELRNRAKDGTYYWVDTTIVPFKDREGKVYQIVAIHHDITRQKNAELEAHILSAKLMSAQEKERARLARELHDDLSQSLALLSIQLQSLGGEQVSREAIRENVEQLTTQIQSLSNDVHRISHELHPSKLNQLGLQAALRGFCREISAARGMKVRFETQGVPRDLPDGVSLCLYRVAQEAVQNAVKHSGASNANVRLSAENGEIVLAVSDNGCGFDPSDRSRNRDSLGLISMDERIRASHGSLTIESVISAGTKIVARVPFTGSRARSVGAPRTAPAY